MNNVYTISLDHMLITVFPFYLVTIIGLFLFIQKLIKPSFPSRYLYICSIAGIMGAGIIAWQFDEIRNTQLPQAVYDRSQLQGIPNEMHEKIIERQTDSNTEMLANYWVVAIPNFILLGLGLGIDLSQRKKFNASDQNP